MLKNTTGVFIVGYSTLTDPASGEDVGGSISLGKTGLGKSFTAEDTSVFSVKRSFSAITGTAGSWADNLPSSFYLDSETFNRTYEYYHDKYTEEHR